MPVLTVEDDARIQARISYEDGRAEGLAEGDARGSAQGQELMASLVRRLFGDGRIEDVELAASDAGIRARLCEEYGL